MVGQLAGYWLGDRFGRSLFERPSMARFLPQLEAAQERLDRGGWKVLVVIRFAAVIKAFVPLVAGMSRMRFGPFLIGNVVGAFLWGSLYTLIGFLAGHQWPVVQSWMARGGLVVAGIWVVVLLVILATRWVANHPDTVRRWFIRVGRTRPGYRLVRLVHPTTGARGPATALLVVAGILAMTLWAFGVLLLDVLSREGVFLLDLPIVSYASRFQLPSLRVGARLFGTSTPPVVSAVVMLAMALYHWWRGRRITAIGVALGLSGQWVIVQLVQALVGRRSLVAVVDYGFPSEYMGALATLVVFAIWPWEPRSWKTTVWQAGAALAVLLTVTGSRVLLALEYPVDLVAGMAVGLAWSVVVAALFHERAALHLARLWEAVSHGPPSSPSSSSSSTSAS